MSTTAVINLYVNVYFAEDHRKFSVIPPIQVQGIVEKKRLLLSNVPSSSSIHELRQRVSALYQTFATEERDGEVDSLTDEDVADIEDKST